MWQPVNKAAPALTGRMPPWPLCIGSVGLGRCSTRAAKAHSVQCYRQNGEPVWPISAWAVTAISSPLHTNYWIKGIQNAPLGLVIYTSLRGQYCPPAAKMWRIIIWNESSKDKPGFEYCIWLLLQWPHNTTWKMGFFQSHGKQVCVSIDCPVWSINH